MIYVVGGLALALIWFQACHSGKPVVSEPSSTLANLTAPKSLAAQDSTGNNHGYEGKLYYSLNPDCEDSSQIDTVLQRLPGGETYFIRKDCKDIPRAFVEEKDIRSSLPSPNILSVADKIFQESETVPRFSEKGDSFIYAICRGQQIVEDQVVAFADAILRVHKTEDPFQLKVRVKFRTVVPSVKIPVNNPESIDWSTIPVERTQIDYPIYFNTDLKDARFDEDFYIPPNLLLNGAPRTGNTYRVRFLKPEYWVPSDLFLQNGIFWVPIDNFQASQKFPAQCDRVKLSPKYIFINHN